MAWVWEPLINGLRPGCLVEIYGLNAKQIEELEKDVNGELGQLVCYSGDKEKFYVNLICGVEGYFSPANVKATAEQKRPGEGGSEHSFDLLMGPRTESETLGHEISMCLFEKGFCVLRYCQSYKDMDKTIEMLRDMSSDGSLARLPEEVEEGYLGQNCRGKVTWLDYANKELTSDKSLVKADETLSYIASAFQPYSVDVLEEGIDERTPGLICLSLTDDEEPEFPFPEADNTTLGTFLKTWRRTLVRAVSFSGPGSPDVTLDVKDTAKAAQVPKKQESVSIIAQANTVVLFRPDIYEYSCDAREETLMLMTNFLAQAAELTLTKIEGETAWLAEVGEGPPPPPGAEAIHVLNSVARLPGFMDCQWSYYAALMAATDAVIKVPLARGDVDPYWTPNEETYESWQTTSKHQSYCEGVDMFDNKHFEISNAEAAGMDPVQRLVLETGAQSLAMIGLTKKITNRKSVHAGCAVGNDKLDWGRIPKEVQIGAACGGTSTVLAIISNRFSFCFNLKGPNFVCDTACSASLTSTHCVKGMLKDRLIDPLEWFLSMGAHLVLDPVGGLIGGTQSHMGGPYGRCLTFNASASGYLRGEGVCGMMLKWGNFKGESDSILRATQVGQDGRSASLTAPNGPAQYEMIARAVKEAQMTPPESTVWECHGTGTSLGDPIEVGAVRKIQVRVPRSEPLMLTSNKTNIGHLEGGAAMGGLVKCVLQCKYGRCLPTLHLRTLNPHLEHEAFDAIFETEGASYHYNQGHSQVSSFGFGGSNGHGILWGGKNEILNDHHKLLMAKIKRMAPEEVRVTGRDFDEWEADFPDPRCKNGDEFVMEIRQDDPKNKAAKWEKVIKDEEDDGDFYSIVGNFNEWTDDRMATGDVDGVFTVTVEVPSSGSLEFRFLQDGDSEKVICPHVPVSSRKTDKIIGPSKETNKWQIRAKPGSDMRIELFVKGGKKSVIWLPEKYDS
uniref:Type I polyketide synthase n=1 Tax=Gambierdiscus excentricus TaxID=986170 RepID=A0A1S6K868_9DINO|nr:type I polyketide synthase [Gambierdiscus excentricus]